MKGLRIMIWVTALMVFASLILSDVVNLHQPLQLRPRRQVNQ